jgi:hypothetical protein
VAEYKSFSGTVSEYKKYVWGQPSRLWVSTVMAISIRTSNFGWAHPNRVVSQAVFQKKSAGHPKFGAEREVRASPWRFALILSRLDAPRFPKKTIPKKTPKKLGQDGGRVSVGMSERASALNAHKQ